MKKVIKIICILVLVVAAVAGTCFIFFKNYEKITVPEVDLIDIVYDVEKETLYKGLEEVKVLMNENSTDERLNIIISTNAELDEIWLSLMSYYVEDDFSIQNKDIVSSFNTVTSKRTLINNMVNEYKIKSESTWFKRDLGANDLYVESASYLVEYAKLINKLNSNLDSKSDLNKSVDVKFSMIDIYANIVIDTFSNIEADENEIKYVKDLTNLNKVNSYYEMENSYIVNGKTYSSSALNFISSYSQCDKTAFAKNFATNMETATTLTENSTALQKAVYYYKQVYGLGG